MPSRFMQPFRTPGGESLTASAEPGREVDVTLLRPDPDAPLRPLFELDDYGHGVEQQPHVDSRRVHRGRQYQFCLHGL